MASSRSSCSHASDPGKAKHPRLDMTLASLDDLVRERERSQASARDVARYVEALSAVPLQETSAQRQNKLTESDKACWLLAKYSIETVSKVCRCLSSLPAVGMTEYQRHSALVEQACVTAADAAFLQEFVTEQCPSLLTVIGRNGDDECPLVLAPPTPHAANATATLSATINAR